VKRHALRRLLVALVVAFLLCTVDTVHADRPAPSISVQTLDGGPFNLDSYRNQTLLVELWATWCPYCKRDQAAVDTIASEYGSRGVAVVAIDEGESEATVREYLQQNPRSCTIALDPGHTAASQFGGGGVPEYVLIDHGNIVGIHSGAAGVEGLRALLSHAGSGSRSGTQQASARGAVGGGGGVVGGSAGIPQWVTVPSAQSRNAKPLPKTVFVLSSGESIESDNYTIRSGYADVVVGDQQRRIALNELDMKTTLAVNHKRGVDLKIPTGNNEVFLAF
jgi:thiol-disulfide isomerase/thioredoxin